MHPEHPATTQKTQHCAPITNNTQTAQFPFYLYTIPPSPPSIYLSTPLPTQTRTDVSIAIRQYLYSLSCRQHDAQHDAQHKVGAISERLVYI